MSAAPPEQGLDVLRRVADGPDRWKLFRRAVPDWEYLLNLSAAGVLKTYALPETNCRMNMITGEIICQETGEPKKVDCRLGHCRYAYLMRLRLVTRLKKAYARERKKLSAQL